MVVVLKVGVVLAPSEESLVLLILLKEELLGEGLRPDLLDLL